eukprot:CAMPEP_0182801670 /NCGR_PEP_ID=MMETSP0006_2-20121128/3075_1 /TAXON_ID=97485 /ORGANISM="Prymnesium parvum, Strain Texoma1" /LENGTH=310 /DNA_ID=CAMNT_0024927005 /DNA_START=211 /DNA_END=1140 /DNA_ORIENTATION=-
MSYALYSSPRLPRRAQCHTPHLTRSPPPPRGPPPPPPARPAASPAQPLPLGEGLVQSLEEERRVLLRDAQRARDGEVRARVGVVVRAVVDELDPRHLLRVGRGRADAAARDEADPQRRAHRSEGAAAAARAQADRHRDGVVRRVQQPLAVAAATAARRALAEGGEEGGAAREERRPAGGAQVEEGGEEVEDRREGGAAGVGGAHLGEEGRAELGGAGGDDRAADGDEEVLVGRLDEGVEAAVARGGADGLHARGALHAVGVVDDVRHARLRGEAGEVEELVDAARREARGGGEEAEDGVGAQLGELGADG